MHLKIAFHHIFENKKNDDLHDLIFLTNILQTFYDT